jgi:hypothetical protein
LVFRYSKTSVAAYMQHLMVLDAFDRSVLMSGIKVLYSEGFNPMPRFETSLPLPISIESHCEVASLILCEEIDLEAGTSLLNSRLPEGLHIEETRYYPITAGKKKHSIGSLEWGADYEIHPLFPDDSTILFEAISTELKARSVPEYSISLNIKGYIELRLRLPIQKDFGLLRILESCSNVRPIQRAFRIVKTQFLASTGDGLPISVFRAYEIVS